MQWLKRGRYHPLAGLEVQVELQFPVKPIHALVVPLKTRGVVQVQAANAKAPGAAVLSHPRQPVGNLVVLDLVLGQVAVAGLAGAQHLACRADGEEAT